MASRRHALALVLPLLAPMAWAQAPDGISPRDWSGIEAAHESARHLVEVADDGHVARNPGQGWTTKFDGRGFTVTPDAGEWRWGLELVSYGRRDGLPRVVTTPESVNVSGQRLTYRWDRVVDEWVINDARGIEHGFTVRDRLEGDRGSPLVLEMRTRGELEPRGHTDRLGAGFADRTGASVLTYRGLTAFDADGRRVPARMTTSATGLQIEVEDSGASYPITIDPLVQTTYLKASNPDANDNFGISMAVDGDTIVVGASREGSDADGVDGNQADNGAADSGAAYVFVRSGDTWVQQAYLKASNSDVGDFFGVSVAISGDTIVVGAVYEDSAATTIDGDQSDESASLAGAAYVFVRNGTTWSQQAYLKASNAEANDHFGAAVAIDGDTIVVGAPFEDSDADGANGNQQDNSQPYAGAVYVFRRNVGVWTQEAYLKASNSDGGVFGPHGLYYGDRFGDSLALEGDTLVVGAPFEYGGATGVNGDESDNSTNAAGAAYVLRRQGTTWTQQAYLKASNPDIYDTFGHCVALSGDTVVVGAPLEDSGATGVAGDHTDDGTMNSGAAYVFEWDGLAWSQAAYLKASNTDPKDRFGYAIAIEQGTLVIGGHGESGSASGIGGDEALDDQSFAGAAYLFARDSGSWRQQSYLKASNPDRLDQFGFSLAMSGGTLVVGANQEASAASGVNGSASDDSLYGAGAAYVFDVGLAVSGTGCPEAAAAVCADRPSSAAGFTLACPHSMDSCSGSKLILFGSCSAAPIAIPPPIGCGTCGLLVSPSFGAAQAPWTLSPGLPLGASFCIQCGCIAGSCIDLSMGVEIVVGP
ncbi:MAG: FG-GAP repeat protein [Planctomycetes bacterium]|nr:FG-GAP repeat protein [Planctomycetota bacterium]